MSLKQSIKNGVKTVMTTYYKAFGIPHNVPKHLYLRQVDKIDEQGLDTERVSRIAAITGKSLERVRAISEAYEAREWVGVHLDAARPSGLYGFPPMDLKTLYALVWAYEPRIVVETGTASGMSATAILSYLTTRDDTRLYTIDVEGPKRDDYGFLIPQAFRSHVEIRLQKDEPILPALLEELGQVDLFYHDSVHTVQHMRWEYEAAWPYIRPGGCLASHDVFMTTAFDDFRKAHAQHIAGGGTVGNFGFVIKGV